MRRSVLLVAGAAVVVAVVVGAVGAFLASGPSGGRTETRTSGATVPAGLVRGTGACSARWRVVATGSKVPLLSAVAAISATDVWAVGGSDNLRGKATPAIVHWDGKRLRSYSAFKASGRNGELTAISAVASDDVWAVGIDAGKPVVMHWDGQSWRAVRTPSLGVRVSLQDVKAFSSRDVWAVGGAVEPGGAGVRPLVMHWDGRAWNTIDTKRMVNSSSYLAAIDGTSPRDLWAVGLQDADATIGAGGMPDSNPLSLHWDGRSWRQVPAFATYSVSASVAVNEFGINRLDAVDVRSTSEVWSLGFTWGTGSYQILRWDGRKQRVAYNYGGDGYLADLAAASPSNVWAVGAINDPQKGYDPGRASPLVVHGDGTSWRIQPTPLDGLRGTTPEAVAALSATEIWAVGSHLIARYSC